MNDGPIPKDILKIQKKLATFEKGSRNYNKYTKILKKHIKNHNMKNRVKSHINTIDRISEIVEQSQKELTLNIQMLEKAKKKTKEE
jgi:uncharacterized protein YaaN involved in tellurite resistance